MTVSPTGNGTPEERIDVADARADRALAQATATSALVGLALGMLAMTFLLIADGELGEQTLPQLLVLGLGQVAGLVAAAACAVRLRAVRSTPGSGPGHAAGAAILLRRVIPTVALMALATAVACVAALSPRATSALSAAVSLALLSQLVLVLHVQRRALDRAARRPI